MEFLYWLTKHAKRDERVTSKTSKQKPRWRGFLNDGGGCFTA
jgi:hypothetical protein